MFHVHVEVNCQCDSTAPNNFIGTNNERGFTAERDQRFYLNAANPAPCNGTVNRWRYCIYNPGDIRNWRYYKTTFAVYRAVGTDYQRVSNVTTVSWHGRDINRSQSFNCYNVSVNSFPVQAGDFVAACIYDPSDWSSRQLDLIGRNVTGSLKRTDEGFTSCSENSLPSVVLDNQLETRSSRILHLYATITGRYNKRCTTMKPYFKIQTPCNLEVSYNTSYKL